MNVPWRSVLFLLLDTPSLPPRNPESVLSALNRMSCPRMQIVINDLGPAIPISCCKRPPMYAHVSPPGNP